MEYRGLTLDTFQSQAIDALQRGSSVLVCAPTGTGKTLIADWIIEQALNNKKQAVYTAPIKALSNQKFRDYCSLHGEHNVGLVTGDLVIRRDAPCRVMTTEILRNILLHEQEVPDLAAVVLDEIHFLDDRERGTVWEEVLIYLPPHVQIVGLSATLSNLEDFAEWLSHVRGHPVEVIIEETRAVPLDFQYFSRDIGLQTPSNFERQAKKRAGRGRHDLPAKRRGRGRHDSHRRSRRTTHMDVFRVLQRKQHLPYLYFVFSRKDTELCARSLVRSLDERLLSPDEQAQVRASLSADDPSLQAALNPELEELYMHGVAFHHAGLHVTLKRLVEELYEQRLVRVLYCTSTFALGINVPARTVVFDGLQKYDGTRMAPLTTRQFMQKAGRAGRRGLDTEGTVVIRLDVDDFKTAKPQLDRYQSGRYEPVRSSFNLGWNSIVNLLSQYELERIRQIIERSFLSWHRSARAQEQLEKADSLSEQNRRSAKKADTLRKRAKRGSVQSWREFETKLNFLIAIGYLDDQHAFKAGANVLQHVQINEILVTEMVLCGIFESITPEVGFGLLCAITNELPRAAKRLWRVTKADRRTMRPLQEIRYSQTVVDAERLANQAYPFDPDMYELGRRWAEGWTLQEVHELLACPTDLSGSLINAFRRAKELASQLREVYHFDAGRVEMFNEMIRMVRRDEVEVVG